MKLWLPNLMLVVSMHVATAGCDAQVSEKTAAPASSNAPTAKAEEKAPAEKEAINEEAVKKFVTGKEEKLATGVGSAHKSVKVEFVEVKLGKPRKTNEQDKIDGVRGETVYPVRVKYKSHRTWGNGETEEKTIHYGYDFFRDEFGEWSALGLGPVK